ncbi:MAG: hypothetical protein ACM3UL_03980 [Ignavibacteria bacterium]
MLGQLSGLNLNAKLIFAESASYANPEMGNSHKKQDATPHLTRVE